MTKKKMVPQLTKKTSHPGVRPESLAAALNWDKVADPGDGRPPAKKK